MLNHTSEEHLELYVFGRLPADQLDRLEEHLLICEACRNELDDMVLYHRSVRAELTREAPMTAKKHWWNWAEWLKTPAFAFAAVAVLAVVAWFAGRASAPSLPLASIQLTAMRGDMQTAPRARQTELRLQDAGASPGEIEVVDGAGKSIWKGKLAAGGIVKISKPLTAGVYFVRTYQGSQLIHEYGFRVAN